MQRTPAPSCSRPCRFNMFYVRRRRLAGLQIEIFKNGTKNPPDVYRSVTDNVVRMLRNILIRDYAKLYSQFLTGMIISMSFFLVALMIIDFSTYERCNTYQTLKVPLVCHPTYMDIKETETNPMTTVDASCNSEASYKEPIPIDCELGIKLNQSVKEPGYVSCYTQVAEFKRLKKIKMLTAEGRLNEVWGRLIVDVTRMYRYQCADTGKYEKEEHIHIDHVFITDKIIITETPPQPKKLISFQK